MNSTPLEINIDERPFGVAKNITRRNKPDAGCESVQAGDKYNGVSSARGRREISAPRGRHS